MLNDLIAWFQELWQSILAAHYFVLNVLLPALVQIWVGVCTLVFVWGLRKDTKTAWDALWGFMRWSLIVPATAFVYWTITKGYGG